MDGEIRWLEWDDLGLIRFAAPGSVVEAWPHPDLEDRAFASAFARELAPIVLQAGGCEALHASGVAGPDGAIAFCGASGSGKSTVAYAMRKHHPRQIADDHVVLTIEGGAVTAWQRPFTPSLRAASAEYFGSAGVADPELGGSWPLAAVIILRPDTGLPTLFTIDPVPPARAFSELLPHAHCFDPGDPREVERLSEHYLTLVGGVPVYRVSYRPSFESLPDLVRALSRLAHPSLLAATTS